MTGIDCIDVPRPQHGSTFVWVVGPVVAGIGLALLVVFFIVYRRRRAPLKQPMDGGQVGNIIDVKLTLIFDLFFYIGDNPSDVRV